jgi:hypothetical protein
MVNSNILTDTWETYAANIRLVLLFSIPFFISLVIPLFVSLPTYISGGGIFLRSASVFLNLNPIAVGVIIVSMFLSLLFLSFALVAIALIVRAKRTHTRHAGNVIRDIEKYTGRVFVMLLAAAGALTAIDVLSYFFGLQGIATPIAGFAIFTVLFYAPTAIVVENKRVGPAIAQSARLVAKEPGYYIAWLALVILVISVLDVALMMLPFGTFLSRYGLLVVNSVFVLPYFVIYQAEAYMRRFPLLKH